MYRDVFRLLLRAAHRVDVRVSSALPLLETTSRQLLALDALEEWHGLFCVTDFARNASKKCEEQRTVAVGCFV